MISIIKASRIAGSGVVLRRHPRLSKPISPNSEPAPAISLKAQPLVSGAGGNADPIVALAAVTIAADADAALCGTSDAFVEERGLENYGNGLEEGHSAGYEAGYADGLQQGLEQGENAARINVEALDKLGATIVEACTAACQQQQASIEAGAIEIAYAALQRLIGERAGDRLIVADAVRLVLAQLRDRTPLAIRLSPADHALLATQPHGLDIGLATLVADERVLLGGCIVDTDAGSLDGRLETRLAELAALLLDLHRTRGRIEIEART